MAAALARDCLAPDLPPGFVSKDPARPAGARPPREGGGEPEWDHAMVFVVGGGSLAERADVERTVAAGCGLPVAYGCTDLVSPPAFLAQLR